MNAWRVEFFARSGKTLKPPTKFLIGSKDDGRDSPAKMAKTLHVLAAQFGGKVRKVGA